MLHRLGEEGERADTGSGRIAIDGKTLRRSGDRGAGKSAIDMVSAWAQANSVELDNKGLQNAATRSRPYPNC